MPAHQVNELYLKSISPHLLYGRRDDGRVKLTRLMLRMNSDDDEGSSLVAAEEAYLKAA